MSHFRADRNVTRLMTEYGAYIPFGCYSLTFKSVKIKEGPVFDDRALRDEWSKAVVAAELTGLLIHDLRLSAIRI